MGGRESFEVQVLQGKRWTLTTVHTTESAAKREAEAVLKGHREYEAARVLRMWMRGDGLEGERQILLINQDGAPLNVTISPIDEAPWCQDVDEIYGRESRRMIGRILRKYFDTVFLTPTELLHIYRALRRLEEHETLLPSATDRIANLQTKAKGAPEGLDSRLRREELYRFFDQVTGRARGWSDDDRVPCFDGEDLQALAARIRGLGRPEEFHPMLMTSLCQYLSQGRSWDAKIEKILDLLKPGLDDELKDALDDILSEVLDGASVIQELLGAQESLGAALVAIVRLASGKLSAQGRKPVGVLGRLDDQFAKDVMPACRAVLYDRVKRQLATGRKLAPEGEDEAQAFAALVVALHDGEGGFPEGASMLEALMDRAGRVYAPPDMPPEPKKTVDQMVRLIAETRARMRFLVNLAVTSFGNKNLDVVVSRLGNVVQSLKGLEDFTYPDEDAIRRLGEGTAILREVQDSALPPPVKRKLNDKLDDLLAAYVLHEGIVEKLDHAGDGLRARAERLVRFCASGILMEGKALSIARERTQALLRQPDFVAKFVEGVADAKVAEQTLRQFHLLLAKAGFKSG